MSDDKEAQYTHVLHAIFKDYSRLEPTLPSESLIYTVVAHGKQV